MARSSSKIVDMHGRPIQRASDFEGAASGRRMSTWGTSTAGPNNVLYSNLSSLRSRSRELVRNDPMVDGGLDTLVSNLVGNGINPRWQIENPDLKRAIQLLWSDWVPEADADNLLDFYGLQTLATRAIIESGEVFVRFRPRYASQGLSVPLQLQLLEADHVDESYTTIAANGNEIRMGIEFNAWGQRTGYWMFREHPGETNIFLSNKSFERVFVPASEVLHVFKPLRAGQQRGRPWLASVLVTLHEMNQYDDAEIVRKKTAAMFGGFISKPPTEDDDAPNPLGMFGTDDANGNTVIAMEPGTFPELPPGYEVKFSTPADVGGNYEAFVKRHDRRASRGFGGLTYEKYTGNLEGVNYSSIRSGNLEFQRQCKQFIQNVLGFQFSRPIAKYWLNQAYLAGKLNLPSYRSNPRQYWRIKWNHDGWPWVDPLKDLQAAKDSIRSGLSTRTKELAEKGIDVEEMEMEAAEENTRADALGLIFDSDGRQTDKTGKAKIEAQPTDGATDDQKN